MSNFDTDLFLIDKKTLELLGMTREELEDNLKKHYVKNKDYIEIDESEKGKYKSGAKELKKIKKKMEKFINLFQHL